MDSEPQKLFSDTDSRVITKVCEESGEEFELQQTKYGSIWFPDIKYCDAVLDRFAKEEKEREATKLKEHRKQLRKDWINENIPPYFQQDLDRSIPHIDWTAMDNALKWNNRSLVLKGETRKGKTRALYEIVKKNALLFPYVKTAERLARILGSHLSKSASDHERHLRFICNQRLVCIDDIGKENITHRTQADLFEIINYRLEHQKPTIITTNFDSQGLANRFTDQELAIPLIARISEFKIIQFR